jgi:hypothetical protein
VNSSRRSRTGVGPAATACLLALLAALAGCGGHDRALYPFAAGRWWYYEIVADTQGELRHERLYVTNLRVNGDTLLQRHHPSHLQQVRRSAAGFAHVVADRRQAPREALQVPATPVAGAHWTIESELRLIESRTFAAADRILGRRLPLELVATVVTNEATVQVPAGTFERCLHVRYTGTRNLAVDRGTLLVAVQVTHDAWYAPGVGLVRATRQETADSSFLRSGSYTQALITGG